MSSYNKICMAATCCSCNGVSAKCVRCVCVKEKKPCLNCFPSSSDNCQNITRLRQARITGKNLDKNLSVPSTCTQSPPMDTPQQVKSSALDAPTVTSQLRSSADTVGGDGHPEDTIYVDSLMNTTFGESIIQLETNNTDNVWYNCWLSVAHLSGKLYSLPRGSVGRKYVENLPQEVSHLSAGNYPSYRLIVFSSVLLQRNRMVRKEPDIRRVIEKQLSKWCNEDFDLLIQEAICYDKSLKHNHKHDDN